MNFSASIKVPGLGGVTEAASKLVDQIPFPLCPGQFWAEAIKTIYGPGHVLIGLSPNPVFTDGDGNPLEVGPLLSGLIFTLGVGTSSKEGLGSVMLCWTLKMINLTGGVAIEYDQGKPGEDCTLVTLDPAKVFNKFLKFANPTNWPSLTKEFTESPIKFYERNIEIFYPAGININMNARATFGGIGEGLIGTLGNRSTINRELIWIKCGDTPKFPPTNNVGFNPDKPIEFVDEANPENVIAKLEKIETLYGHFFNDERICQAIVASTLTFDFIREQVNKFFTLPSS